MTKPGLGRGLDRLMNGDKAAGPAAENGKAAPRPAAAQPLQIGRGLNQLLAESKPQPAPVPKTLLPPWFFFSADLLLLAYCVAICSDAPKPLDTGHLLFCAVSVTLGAVLAIIGVLKCE